MAAKLETLRATARVDYNGKTYCAGTDNDTFECDPKEAKRLKALGAAVSVTGGKAVASRPAGPTQEELAAQQELLASIAEAETEEVLSAIIPEEEPAYPEFAEQIAAAVKARLSELEG